MRTILSYVAAVAAFAIVAVLAVAPAYAGNCSTSSPINVPIATNAFNTIANGGTFDGTYNLQGTANCPDTDLSGVNNRIDNTLAVSAALSSPVWLDPRENVSVSGGVGFSDGATALGATGMVRLDKNFSAFGGGAMSTDGNEWAGKAGIRVGF